MKLISNALQTTTVYQSLQQAYVKQEGPVAFSGLSHIHRAWLLSTLVQETSPLLVVTADEREAKRLSEDINTMCEASIARSFPAKEPVLTPTESATASYEQERLGTLTALALGKCKIVCTGIEAVMQPTIPLQELQANLQKIKIGDEVNVPKLVKKLAEAGYSRCETVSGAGQFSLRGDILDIFPIHMTTPVRIEFWDDTVDLMALFDTETQRRTDDLEQLVIPPAREFLIGLTELSELVKTHAMSLRGKHNATAKEKLLADAQLFADGLLPAHYEKYAPLAREQATLVCDYSFSQILFSEINAISETEQGVWGRYEEDVKLLLEQGYLCRGLEGYYQEHSVLESKFAQHFCVYMSTFLQGKEKIPYRRLLHAEFQQIALWGGELKQLVEDLQEYIESDYCVMLYAGTEKTQEILQKDLQRANIDCRLYEPNSEYMHKVVWLRPASVNGGLSCEESKFALITQSRNVQQNSHRKRNFKKGKDIRTLADITEGDIVVHATHGIGRFVGIRKLEMDNVVKDYITIEYAGGDKLYVPVTQLDMVSKYTAPGEETKIKLTSLNSGEWQKTRKRVRSAVKDMAEELLALYAKREATKGFSFWPDDRIQHEFEERFPYAETEDQLQCIEEIKQDMERSRPMDRLLCGDVGFGKTEVAFRAAMKCVLSGKQCAILVPTTVLAMQHYQTALQRFEQFPVNIAMLSRFVPKKKQQEILQEIRSGKTDIIIGTHRIVQKDMEFRNLGLAIVDEEQRFGVAHKERFKQMFAGVDMLTLSATPIPRTLNMAMSGIRDMSVIAEPPQDRYPIQTFVLEYNESIIQQAIARELKRDGQVYYIHNRIETMPFVAARLQSAFPHARILVANGQMPEGEMSKIWKQMMEHEADILVCTTIIETGVDIANVNTMLIDNADHFGLSQLYQLRGRVGRSNRRAYAYFTYQKNKVLNQDSAKRLSAIREFTTFGSGYHIAMKDLEIRGAGSILGGTQHGHIESVGYDIYIKMLNEAIAEAKGQPIEQVPECTVDIQITAHIPEDYIESLNQRLDIYRKIALVKTDADETDIIDELIDRYGEPPKEILGLISVAKLRNTAANMGIIEIGQHSGCLRFYMKQFKPESIAELSGIYRSRLRLNLAAIRPNVEIAIEEESPLELIQRVLQILQNKN